MSTDNSTGPLSTGVHEIDIDGVSQRYHVAGSGPVCLVHPGGPGFTWDYLRMPALEERLTMVYVEPIGTGGSGRLVTHPNGYTRDAYVQALGGLISHLGVPRVHLLGHSHGGFVTQYYAQKNSDRLGGIILYESAPAVGLELLGEATRNLEAFARKNAGNPELDRHPRRLAIHPSDRGRCGVHDGRLPPLPRLPRRLLGPRSRVRSPPGVGHRFLHLGPRRLHGPRHHRRPGHTQLHHHGHPGDRGSARLHLCGPRWANDIHEHIPQSRLTVLEDSGHFGHIEEPRAFADAVAEFVTK